MMMFHFQDLEKYCTLAFSQLKKSQLQLLYHQETSGTKCQNQKTGYCQITIPYENIILTFGLSMANNNTSDALQTVIKG